ncbi:unnamed protein product [Symbiodinium natans]|uniref:Deacetylase sirtuin-type domain-containing protein n=1 Tax=Symbiodinium natans TaxID=878477 RepID=A0A812RB63_9DINO|nr:unnamed protein product [Symbiodinium natans]
MASATTDRPLHDLLFGRDPGEAVPTHAHARELIANVPHECERLAALLRRADAILVGTGAGWSADSGLATYKDVADVPALRAVDLSYYDLCQTRWLREDPAVYYGFWGYCLSSYRRATPHEGYRIVKKWSEDLCNRTPRFRERFAAAKLSPVFIYSSNVDAHWHRDGLFTEDATFEFHGTCEDWCCSGSEAEGRMSPCCQDIWPVPADFHFVIDEKTMRAESKESAEPNESSASEMPEHGGCPFSLAQKLGNPNRPRCPRCRSLLRPRVLHFGDGKFFEREGERERFERWAECVFDCMTLCSAPLGDGEKDPAKHVLGASAGASSGDIYEDKGAKGGEEAFCLAVLEFGCGLNVPSVRRESERHLDMYPENCVLVRVNPDFPLVLEKEPRQRIEIMAGALEAVRAADALLRGKEPEVPKAKPREPLPKPEAKPRARSGSRAKKG